MEERMQVPANSGLFWIAGRRARGSYVRCELVLGRLLVLLTSLAFEAGFLWVAAALLYLPIWLWMTTCLRAQRLHDMGYTGWLQALGYLVAITFLIVRLRYPDHVWLVRPVFEGYGPFLAWLSITKSVERANRYGMPPHPKPRPGPATAS